MFVARDNADLEQSTALNNFGQGAPPTLKPGSLEDGVRDAIRLSLLGKDGETGTFTQYNDAEDTFTTVPW